MKYFLTAAIMTAIAFGTPEKAHALTSNSSCVSADNPVACEKQRKRAEEKEREARALRSSSGARARLTPM